MQPLAVQGLAETYSLFARVPAAAEEQLAEEIREISTDVLAAQKRDVRKKTGQLEGGLDLEVQVEQLRSRVGLLNVTGQRSKLFYGRIVEAGRRAQTVLVQRRRRVGGKLRLGPGRRKRTEDIAAQYSLRVKHLAPHPFVHVERPEIRAEQRLAAFWSKVLGKAGAAA